MNLFDLCVYKNLNKESGGDVDVSSLVATENKTYNAGTGKAYNPVVVNVPKPVLDSITINENGHFTPPAGTDGYDDITVYVPYVTQGTTINENGDYTPPSGVDGFGRVIVDVPTPPPSLQSLTASHNGYFVPSSGYVGFSEVNVDVALPQNAYLLESQKNDVVSIQHGAEFDMPKLVADITPKQDLHGYDSPWVGGSGKNKIPMTVDGIKSINTSGSWSGNAYTYNGVTFTLLTDSDGNISGININGTASASTYILLESNNNGFFNNVGSKAVVMSGCPSGGSTSTYYINRYASSASSVNIADVGSGASFTYPSTEGQHNITISINNGYTANNLKFYPMIRLASVTDSTFAPYSNECPISGWTACNVVRSGGQNYLDVPDRGNVQNNYIFNATDVNIPVGTYVFSFNVVGNPTNLFELYDATSGSNVSLGSASMQEGENTLTFTTNTAITKILAFTNTSVAVNITDIKINQSNTYTINFVDGSNPLIVYKGELDVLSGLLKAYPHYDSYNGETINGEWISDRDAYSVDATPTIGAEVQVISGSDYTTYQQTANNVKSLEGVNSINADTGEVDVQIWTKEVTS